MGAVCRNGIEELFDVPRRKQDLRGMGRLCVRDDRRGLRAEVELCKLGRRLSRHRETGVASRATCKRYCSIDNCEKAG